ncbi:hypothetical protein DICVIV_11001 [Dictyocaulus viviparus]|uniref:RLR CTR domain-containing protein n=1 Tax=Dictyocaulus viviparus TaxID=29172 RepID=A0A0D8XKW0_DICVI|nr:hypothetical protein DICVIV_11001 [Dictyocaulus viviparus]
MNKCISRIQEQGERALEKRVLEVMERQKKEREVILKHKMKEIENLKDKLFTISCKIDNKYVCMSTHVRTINGSSYVCVDSTIWRRLTIKTKQTTEKGKFVDEVTQILADTHCACGQIIGTIMKYAFTISCKIDNKYVCMSTHVRTINGSSYVCVDSTIWRRLTIKTKQTTEKGKFVDEVTQILADTHCACGQIIGTIMKYAGTYLPTINISNVIFSERIDGRDSTQEPISSWSKAGDRFWIPEANEQELRQMLLSLITENTEGKFELDVMCDKMIAVQKRMLEKERRKQEEVTRLTTDWDV